MTIDARRVRAYLAAAADALPLYEADAVAPPLAVAALALGALLEAVALPAGSLHVNESLQFLRPVPLGATVECHAVLAQRSQRGGMIVSVIDSQIMAAGDLAISARATVMSPLSGTAPA